MTRWQYPFACVDYPSSQAITSASHLGKPVAVKAEGQILAIIAAFAQLTFTLVVQVFALGFVSVFDQVLDGMPDDTEKIFKAYIDALDEDSNKYRQDSDRLAGQAKDLTKSSELTPDENGNDVSISFSLS